MSRQPVAPGVVPRRTRLVCTLSVPRADGARPQDRSDYVPSLIAAGMDVARVNLSHCGAAAEFAAGRAPRFDAEEALVRRVRSAAAGADAERHVAVLLDLQGVKVRLRLPATLRDAGLPLAAGETVRVRITRERRDDEVVCDGSAALLGAVREGLARHRGLSVAIGDGEPFLRCTALDGDVVLLQAPESCVLGHGKGVTFRGVHLAGEPPLTLKDRVDLAAFVLPAQIAGDADFVALSFTQAAEDVRCLRSFAATADAWFRDGRAPSDPADADLLARLSSLRPDLAARYAAGPPVRPYVVAKVETSAGADAIDDVLDEADAVMVARGDLGLHCAPEDVPRLQKRMIRHARRSGRAAIVATQMLESMLTAPEPRRSEATDVFNAVLDGADALMLSGESAVGQRPREATATLARIACAAERWETFHPETRDAWMRVVEKEVAARRDARAQGDGDRGGESAATRALIDSSCGDIAPQDDDADGESTTDRITADAVRTAEALGCTALVAATRSGRTARSLARFDPMLPIVAIVPDARVARSLALVAAVRAIVAPASSGDDALAFGLARAVDLGYVARGARVVVASARPDDPPGVTTTLSVRVV